MLALRLTASRLALLHGRDLAAALAALHVSERRLRGVPAQEALADPELRDLVVFALSEEGLTLLGGEDPAEGEP